MTLLGMLGNVRDKRSSFPFILHKSLPALFVNSIPFLALRDPNISVVNHLYPEKKKQKK